MYDLNLVKRRAWLFIPLFLLGLFVAFVLVSAAGDANAVATMQIETVVHDAVGGDRGLRIFEAESMTTDEKFKAKVRARAAPGSARQIHKRSLPRPSRPVRATIVS